MQHIFLANYNTTQAWFLGKKKNMIRKIINIDENKCNGCGLCAEACYEGAIGIVNDKATLLRDDYCDGLGDCLPACPTGAITFVEREAAAYDDEAVKAHMLQKAADDLLPDGYPDSVKRFAHKTIAMTVDNHADDPSMDSGKLGNWPLQIKLTPVNAPYYHKANLLIAADCTAFAFGDFHRRFIKGKIVLIGCPKLDNVAYVDKLTEIIKNNELRSITVVRMEVPCCGGLEQAVKDALRRSGKMIPWHVVVISTDGQVVEEL